MSLSAILIGTLIELLVMLTFASASTVIMLGVVHCFLKEDKNEDTQTID